MRWGPRAITAFSAFAYAVGAACGGGGGSDTFTISGSGSAFPQGFLPVVLSAGAEDSGDVAFRAGGDLYAVDGRRVVTAVSRSNGGITTFAANVGDASTKLRSIVVGPDGRVFAGADDGRIWATTAGGSTFTEFEDTGNSPITGLAVAPANFGDFVGSLIAAAGTSGILRITTGESPAFAPLAAGNYVDLAFSDTTLFALDATGDDIDTVSPTGVIASFQGGFGNPMGMAVDDGRAEILVADAGDDVLHALPVSGGAPSDRAPYDFDPVAPSGIAYDGVGAIAFVASGTIHGSAVPRIDPANPNFGRTFIGPTVGYGDLELDRSGAFILVANDDDDPFVTGDATTNFLFRVSRDGSAVSTLASAIGAAGEDLLSVAVDPATETIYFGSRLGNVYKRDAAGSVSLLVSIPAPAVAVLGLELAPAGFGGFGGHLVATTTDGRVFAIDPLSPTPTRILLSGTVSRLSDLVFAADATLYVVDNGATTSRILEVASDGTITNLMANPTQLGRPDGIEIDEGGDRLLVTTDAAGSGPDQLLAVDLLAIPAAVTPLANVDIDDAFFPTGIVYDRLGTAILRQGDAVTALDAVSVFP